MKNITRLKITFTSLAFAIPLMVLSGCGQNPSQTGNMTTSSMAATNEPHMDSTTTDAMNHMTPSQMGHMESNSMNMAGSSMNNMTSNNMNMSHSPQTGNMMMSGSMGATNQSK